MYHCLNSRLDRLGKGRPGSDEFLQLGIKSYPFLQCFTATISGIRRKPLIGQGFATRSDGSVDPVVAGSSPVVLALVFKHF